MCYSANCISDIACVTYILTFISSITIRKNNRRIVILSKGIRRGHFIWRNRRSIRKIHTRRWETGKSRSASTIGYPKSCTIRRAITRTLVLRTTRPKRTTRVATTIVFIFTTAPCLRSRLISPLSSSTFLNAVYRRPANSKIIRTATTCSIIYFIKIGKCRRKKKK